MASEASEMLADIVSEMRYGAIPRHQTDHELLAIYADRIEAVAKRQSVTGGHGLGDAAAMRKALANLVDVIDRCDSGSPLWWHCGAKGVKPLKDAKAALAKPPRNCDRFDGDYKMLHSAWFDWTGSPSGQNPDGTVKLTFAKWLLAPATEQKGETDGSK